MDNRVILTAAGLSVVTIALGQIDRAPAGDAPGDTGIAVAPAAAPARGQIGPDVIVGDLHSARNWATNDTETAFTIGTTSCNVGDLPLDWFEAPDVDHPVISQNLFLLLDGRFEHIGQAWLKHGFCAVQGFICGECKGPGGCGDYLYPLCSDPYSATLNGQQFGLGPKWQVNAHTGEFPLPWDNGSGTSGDFKRRIRAKNTDLDAGLAGGGRFFIEGMYTAKDDALWGNQNNNASYREVSVLPPENLYFMGLLGTTQRERPGIMAWADHDEGVTLEFVQVDADGERDVNNRYDDGRFIVGYKVTDNEDGTWDYEYAVYNQNSHRSARDWSVPVPDGVTLTNVDFHDVDYHSGDGIDGLNYDRTDWATARDDESFAWSTDTFEANENANALRWATLYNFRFTADAAPAPRTATLGLYRPGTPDAMEVAVLAPSSCPEDIDGSGDVDFQDIIRVLDQWGNEGGPADIDGSGRVDFDDLLRVLQAWGPC